jgi:DNA polymerase-4
MARHIAHLDIPDFYATLEELRHPELHRRPLALAALGARAVIQGVNAIARREGIDAGMPVARAQRSCRRLQVIPPDLPFYQRQHQQVLQVLNHFSPLVEGTLWGHYFVDLTGTRRLWGAPPDLACRMEQQLAVQHRLRARVGLAATKLVSQVAANLIAPGELCDIFPGGEHTFLAPLPVTALPGVGQATAARLTDFNIRHVGQLAALPGGSLATVFGKMGPRLLQLARGIDPAPVIPFQEAPRLCLARNLERDEIVQQRLDAILWQQVEEAGWMLRRHNRYAGQFMVEIRYADGVTAQQRHPLPPITTNLDQRLFQVLRPVCHQLAQRRVAVRRLVLEFTQFTMPMRQMSLFPWEETALRREQKLQQAMDGIRQRFGRHSLVRGRTLFVSY